MKLNSVIAVNAMEAIRGTHATLTDVIVALKKVGIVNNEEDLADDLTDIERDMIVSLANTLNDVMTNLCGAFGGSDIAPSAMRQLFVKLLHRATYAGGDEDLRREYNITVAIICDQLKVENWQTALSLALLPSILSMGGLKEYAIARALIRDEVILFEAKDLAIWRGVRGRPYSECLRLAASAFEVLKAICQYLVFNDASK